MKSTVTRLTVGVMGSGTSAHVEDADAIGTLLGELGVNLLTGGGGGVMKAVSRAFTRHPGDRGICIGIIPCASEADRNTPKAGYPNEFVELAIYTHLPYSGVQGTHDLSRNHINVLSSAAIVALPGEHGTAAEIALAVKYGKPVIAYSSTPALLALFPGSARRVDNVDGVRQFLRKHLGRRA